MTAAIIMAAVIALSGGVLASLWTPSDRQGPVQEIVVPDGAGAGDVARILEREGIIRTRYGFLSYAILTGTTGSLQAGTYRLCSCQSVPSIVASIADGDALSNDLQLTIPEGTNIWDLDALLLELGIIKRAGQFSAAYSDREGRLFPETYRFSKDVLPEGVAARLSDEFASRAAAYTSEQLIIASILEKEAKTPDDMALVSGIIQRRLGLGMPLQIDATVGYGWCVRTAGFSRPCDVTQAPIASEIKVDGPYNTYAHLGLPTKPIANPGMQALKAAANPQESDFLYYLSTRDGSEIIYSKTLDEHLRNRREYLGF